MGQYSISDRAVRLALELPGPRLAPNHNQGAPVMLKLTAKPRSCRTGSETITMSLDNLRELYQQVIIEHIKLPRHRGKTEPVPIALAGVAVGQGWRLRLL